MKKVIKAREIPDESAKTKNFQQINTKKEKLFNLSNHVRIEKKVSEFRRRYIFKTTIPKINHNKLIIQHKY